MELNGLEIAEVKVCIEGFVEVIRMVVDNNPVAFLGCIGMGQILVCNSTDGQHSAINGVVIKTSRPQVHR